MCEDVKTPPPPKKGGKASKKKVTLHPKHSLKKQTTVSGENGWFRQKEENYDIRKEIWGNDVEMLLRY